MDENYDSVEDEIFEEEVKPKKQAPIFLIPKPQQSYLDLINEYKEEYNKVDKLKSQYLNGKIEYSEYKDAAEQLVDKRVEVLRALKTEKERMAADLIVPDGVIYCSRFEPDEMEKNRLNYESLRKRLNEVIAQNGGKKFTETDEFKNSVEYKELKKEYCKCMSDYYASPYFNFTNKQLDDELANQKRLKLENEKGTDEYKKCEERIQGIEWLQKNRKQSALFPEIPWNDLMIECSNIKRKIAELKRTSNRIDKSEIKKLSQQAENMQKAYFTRNAMQRLPKPNEVIIIEEVAKKKDEKPNLTIWQKVKALFGWTPKAEPKYELVAVNENKEQEEVTAESEEEKTEEVIEPVKEPTVENEEEVAEPVEEPAPEPEEEVAEPVEEPAPEPEEKVVEPAEEPAPEPEEKVVEPVEEPTAEPEEEVVEPAEEPTAEPEEEVVEPAEEPAIEPEEEVVESVNEPGIEPEEKVTEPVDESVLEILTEPEESTIESKDEKRSRQEKWGKKEQRRKDRREFEEEEEIENSKEARERRKAEKKKAKRDKKKRKNVEPIDDFELENFATQDTQLKEELKVQTEDVQSEEEVLNSLFDGKSSNFSKKYGNPGSIVIPITSGDIPTLVSGESEANSNPDHDDER